MALILLQEHLRQILEHARAEAPNEACGLLAGRDGYVTHVLPATNVAENPRVRYLMDPHDQLDHFQAIEEQGLDLLGIYHSHPASPAYPSATDLSMAYYPEAVYAIISLVQNNNPVLRAFRMADEQISEVIFKVIPPEATGSQSPNPLPESTRNLVDEAPL
jgi:proteasome lid subunit RPN8/RPN11